MHGRRGVRSGPSPAIGADRWLQSAEHWLQRLGQLVVSGVAGLAGAAFLTVGVAGLLMT